MSTDLLEESNIDARSRVEAVRWVGDAATGHLELLDQRLLPQEETFVTCSTAEATADAIRDMIVRGAPAIGLAAAFGVVLAAQELGANCTSAGIASAVERLGDARPTAVNLRWALERMGRVLESHDGSDPLGRLLIEAIAIRDEDLRANHAMGDFGADLLDAGSRVLTYCNTGSLATAGYGTALGVVRSANHQGKLELVYACETRPYLQGARLTMWELLEDEIPAVLITDNMPGLMMARREIDAIVVGADRIASNGDTANKIGTYQLAVLAQHHGIPFYVAAPRSTIDLYTADGSEIPIEERSIEEVVNVRSTRIAPEGATARHPAFDVTPAALISAIITEAGVARAPFGDSLRALFDKS